jgi:hypothetical protein
MFCFGRRKQVVLHAFTAVPRLAEVFPPDGLHRMPPKWWSELPSYVDTPHLSSHSHLTNVNSVVSKIPTIKHCYALQELFKHAIGIRLWQDIDIAMEPDGSVLSRGPGPRAAKAGDAHPLSQFHNAFVGDAQHFKLFSPWLFVCDSLVHFMWTHPFYHQRDPFRFQTMSGVVEYRNQHNTEINILFPRVRHKRTEISIAAGEMMAYVLPLTDVDVKVVASEISPKEMERKNYARYFTLRPLLFNRRHNVAPEVRSPSWRADD